VYNYYFFQTYKMLNLYVSNFRDTFHKYSSDDSCIDI